MDVNNVEHSDSDSGESWTLLEATPAYGDQVPEFPESAIEITQDVSDSAEANCEKDEDTDGISIISDSDPESSLPCDLTFNRCLVEANRPADQHDNNYFSVNPSNNNNNHEYNGSVGDFLGDNSGKHKTYVHKRNKRLSTVLNIIVLGSVITAAGVAIGHMWGVKDDCILQTTPSVNKILSNLYKLQEENSYLRSKLKELTLLNNIQMQNRKYGSEKVISKQNKCKKVFEESINNKNVEKYTKCVDIENNSPKIFSDSAHMSEPEYEKEFASDINRLKVFYEQNKSWLDEEVSKRINHEKQLVNKLKNNDEDVGEALQEKNFKKPSATINELHTVETDSSEMLHNNLLTDMEKSVINKSLPGKKVSYADSLHFSSDSKTKKIEERDTSKYTNKEKEQIRYKAQLRKNNDIISEQPLNDDELIKDNRYVGQRHKQEIRKFDRQKSHKKQKRKNKYEQWEMKGGYMKNYDEFSITSQDSDVLDNQETTKLNENIEIVVNDHSSQINDNTKSRVLDNLTEKNVKDNKIKQKDVTWYENRAVLRKEARTKLQKELLGDSSNSAGWYFRRMQRREQCRTKDDNSTQRKFLKRNMNFKTKH